MASGTRPVKTDRRDVAALAEANRHGWYRATHRVSATQRDTRQILRSRRLLVQQRTGTISSDAVAAASIRLSLARAAVATTVPARLARLVLPPTLADDARAAGGRPPTLTTEIHTIDARVRPARRADPIVTRAADGAGRRPRRRDRPSARSSIRVDALPRTRGKSVPLSGSVPREDSSAERRHRGHITKAGPARAARLCIQAAWTCWRSPRQRATPDVGRAPGRASRRRIAFVALARLLSRILYAVWRDRSSFDVTRFATT